MQKKYSYYGRTGVWDTIHDLLYNICLIITYIYNIINVLYIICVSRGACCITVRYAIYTYFISRLSQQRTLSYYQWCLVLYIGVNLSSNIRGTFFGENGRCCNTCTLQSVFGACSTDVFLKCSNNGVT